MSRWTLLEKPGGVRMVTKTTDPIGTNYAGVVLRDSVRIAFTLAAMNGLDICAADIQNIYTQAPTS